MSFLTILKSLFGPLFGVPSVPPPAIEPPVTDVSVAPELPAADNRMDADAPPKVIEPLKPPLPRQTTFEERLRDRRSVASPKHDYGKRDWSKVTGICLHQTACVLGENPPRWDTVGCHAGVTRNGQVILLHDFDRLIVHGNGWNTQTVGIEIDGTYEGIEGDIKTFWKDPENPKQKPQRPTAEAIEATKQLIRFICAEVERHGGKVKALVAHRQASVNRRSDPGSAIWKQIALPMSEELGLNDGGEGFKLGNGYAIPTAWDPKRKAKY